MTLQYWAGRRDRHLLCYIFWEGLKPVYTCIHSFDKTVECDFTAADAKLGNVKRYQIKSFKTDVKEKYDLNLARCNSQCISEI